MLYNKFLLDEFAIQKDMGRLDYLMNSNDTAIGFQAFTNNCKAHC